ncbi:MAG: hypothetical protein ACLR17_00920 [Enterobacteriaceae bacterium]|nr:hypothetical protein [Klebsiella michiganensis]
MTQHQTLCATMDVSFTVYPSALIAEKEKLLAEAAMQAAIAEQNIATHGVTHVQIS